MLHSNYIFIKPGDDKLMEARGFFLMEAFQYFSKVIYSTKRPKSDIPISDVYFGFFFVPTLNASQDHFIYNFFLHLK